MDSKEPNPYAPPLSSHHGEIKQRKAKFESPKVRVLAALLGLACLPLPFSIEYSRANFSLFVAALLSVVMATEFGIIACIGRPFLFGYVVDQPSRSSP